MDAKHVFAVLCAILAVTLCLSPSLRDIFATLLGLCAFVAIVIIAVQMYLERQLAIMVERFGNINPLDWARNRFAQAIGGIAANGNADLRVHVQMTHPPTTGVRHPSITGAIHPSTIEGLVTASPTKNMLPDHYLEPSPVPVPVNEQNDVDGETVMVDKPGQFHAEHGNNQRAQTTLDYVQKGVWILGKGARIANDCIHDALADKSQFDCTFESDDSDDGDSFELIVPAQ